MRFIDQEDLYRLVRVARANGGDHVCHPRFFFSAVGAWRGTVLAKRL